MAEVFFTNAFEGFEDALLKITSLASPLKLGIV